MNEIYWITRFDALHGLGIAITIIAGISAFVFLVCNIERDDAKERNFLKCFVQSLFALIIGISVLIFVPTTNEALLIYGVGGTIDYIKSNDKAKKLPDKVVDALDKWLDSQNKDK